MYTDDQLTALRTRAETWDLDGRERLTGDDEL